MRIILVSQIINFDKMNDILRAPCTSSSKVYHTCLGTFTRNLHCLMSMHDTKMVLPLEVLLTEVSCHSLDLYSTYYAFTKLTKFKQDIDDVEPPPFDACISTYIYFRPQEILILKYTKY